ncbi:hypothetical protein [uncultured Dokdonia sp.]|uniref:hypothetical protein n=1 Tax=uncultured Dokdonia sp. TaxID=575653 RepID=UPI00262A8108|nr:hypothetical protein [uncultured Dokdonia sp.]
MTFRFPIECNICNFQSVVKVQAGYLEKSFVCIGCPSCGSLFKGELLQIPPNVKIDFDNAKHINLEEIPIDTPIIPISTELPIPKISKQIIGGASGITLNPYIALGESMDYETISIFKNKYLAFAEYRSEKEAILENIISLFQANKWELVISESKKHFAPSLPELNKTFSISIESCFFIISEIFKLFILNVIPKSYENSYTIRLLFRDTINRVQKDKTSLAHLKKSLGDFYNIEKEFIIACKILITFIKNSISFVPVIALSYIGFNETFNDSYGITTFSFDELKDNYKDSFELIARSSILYIGFSNYYKNRDENNFKSVSSCNSLNEYYKLNNGNKRMVIEQYPYLKKYFRFLLDNQLRNAIGHTKTEFFTYEQLIKYYPYTALNKKDKFKEKTLVDFAYHTFLLNLSVLDLVSFIGKWHKRII